MSAAAAQVTMSREELNAVIRDVAGKVAAERAEESSRRAIEEQHRQTANGGQRPGANQGDNVASLMERIYEQGNRVSLKSGVDVMYRQLTPSQRAADPYALPGVAVSQERESEFFTHGMAPRIVRFLILAKMAHGHISFASKMAKEAGFPVTAKALDTTNMADGGALIDPAFSSEIIEALRPMSVVRAAGPRMVPLNGTLFQSFIDLGSTAYYVGENQTATRSQPKFGMHQMQERKLVNLVVLSNEMLRQGGQYVESAIMQDMIRGIAVREDAAFLLGDGTQFSPRGIAKWAKYTRDANTTVNLVNVTADGAYLPASIEAGNVAITRGQYFMSPRSRWYLRTLRTTNGDYAFPEIQQGEWLGYKIASSTQIPNNTGGLSSGSQIIFANMDDVQIGQGPSVQVDSFPGGAYNDSGTVVSGISNDQTVLRVMEVHDLMCRQRGYEAAFLTDVRWS